MSIRVCGPRSRPPKGAPYINTTSRDIGPFKGLSPFFLGPVDMYFGLIAKNVENAWQFSKVYGHQADKDGNPTDEWVKWALQGYNDSYAHRYPAGKGKKPLYSFWKGQKLGYVEARKQIYCPLYAEAVEFTPAWKMLIKEYQSVTAKGNDLWLWDFDGYDHVGRKMTLEEVLNHPRYKMGHAFVLAMMIEGTRYWED